MAPSHFSLTWDAYQNAMCSSFSSLQQNGDFVDLTLAADGHLVKVHQLILGIASPYIKELINSAPCKHPVIFLNNVSYLTLGHILQYVYTGEVAITEDQLTDFFNAARALKIRGIDDNDVRHEAEEEETNLDVLDTSKVGLQTIQVHVSDEKTSRFEEISVPIAAKNIKLTTVQESDAPTSISQVPVRSGFKRSYDGEQVPDEEMEDLARESQDVIQKEIKCDADPLDNFQLTRIETVSPTSYTNTKELQYTVSNRGSLQLILNRYVYNLFSKSNGGLVRRWRCVDYRDQKCPACTVTSGNVVVKRTNMHNHSYHDKKILGKIKKKAVYSAVKMTNTERCSNT